jgi:hypothetical protein
MVPSVHASRIVPRCSQAQAAVVTALQRCAGFGDRAHNPWEHRSRTRGEDPRRNVLLLGASGIFRHLPDREQVICGVPEEADSLMLPQALRIGFDDCCALFAVTLAASRDRENASLVAPTEQLLSMT